jgi:hypothetical protein
VKLVLEFEASDSGYSASANILKNKDAEKACVRWCKEQNVIHQGLQDYEMEDDNGFAYAFQVADAETDAFVTAGQYR